jgi:hypothetical protein
MDEEIPIKFTDARKLYITAIIAKNVAPYAMQTKHIAFFTVKLEFDQNMRNAK